MASTNNKFCLATVVSDNYVPATLVMVHSFLKHNPWFQGDIVLIHDGLNEEAYAYFETCFDRVRFQPVSAPFKDRLEHLTAARPDLKTEGVSIRSIRFQSLEVFRLRGYDKVLFCDSDLLFRKSIEELFEMDHELVCCPDGPVYQDRCRDRRTFISIPSEDCSGNDVICNTFNAGLLLIDNKFLTDVHYEGLLSLLDIGLWQSVRDHTDQVVFNLYFEERTYLASCKYNYLLAHRAAIYKKHAMRLIDAHVLHYNGREKPWQADSLLKHVIEDASVIKAYQLWYDAYVECLNFLHIRHTFPKDVGSRPRPG